MRWKLWKCMSEISKIIMCEIKFLKQYSLIKNFFYSMYGRVMIIDFNLGNIRYFQIFMLNFLNPHLLYPNSMQTQFSWKIMQWKLLGILRRKIMLSARLTKSGVPILAFCLKNFQEYSWYFYQRYYYNCKSLEKVLTGPKM
jgi:hypothetical protein